MGNNSIISSSVPVQVDNSTGTSALTGVTAIAGGGYHSLAVKSDGTGWAWGSNGYGQLGNNNTIDSSVPVEVNDPTGTSFLTGVVAAGAGDYHSLAMKSDGSVWAWGYNVDGELGNNSTITSSLPVQVDDPTGTSTLTGVTAISAGGYHNLALKSDGTVWAWGSNGFGQLGDNNTTNSGVPVEVEDSTGTTYLTGVIAIAAGDYHSLALTSDGTVWAWGYNLDGELGNDSTTTSSLPVHVSNLTGVVAITGCGYHSLALKSDGTVWAWGSNGYGELGNDTTSASSVPVQVSDPTGTTYLTGVIAITGGYYHSLVLEGDGTVWAWGNNSNGELGNYTAGYSSSVPVPVTDPTGTSYLVGVAAIAGGGYQSIALVGNSAPSVVLTSSQNPSAVGLPITLTATATAVAPETGTPTGTITFLNGTTLLGSQALSNGVATLSTSSLPSGTQTIMASYSGDSVFGSAQATLTQIVESAWLPVDISVGADDLSRVLWANPNGEAVLWSLNRTTGNYAQGTVFGPYDGGAWQATRIACGKDGISHVLWNNPDGTLSLWWLNADNSFKTNAIFGPFAGWVATDVAVSSDSLTRILWTNVNDGRAVVWSVDATGTASNNTNFYGPYTGYTAVALACGPDGLTRLVWANPLGIASLWIMNAQNQYQSFTIFGPYTGWNPTDIDVGSDNLARILWTNTVDGRSIVWSVDASGNPSNNTNFYGPFTGYTAQRVACGSDGYTRVTWLNDEGVLSFWHMAANNTMLTFNIYGPYF